MPLLTELLGLEVLDHTGRSAGRLHDLVVMIDSDRPPVIGGVVRGDGRVRPLSLTGAEPIALSFADGTDVDGLWLVRDMLDTQVYDISGHCISRVGDVELTVQAGNLVVAAVDVGLAPVLRRLGFAALARLARPRPLAWGELHPLSKRGHSLVFAADPERAHAHIKEAHLHRPRIFHHRASR
ncbi:MAG: hypothetical protein QOG33_646 [Gaiellales bacterium]|jgi:sporulation protein YlmC with PRC-barrel domain|nr:hypothetical protein [Gaiellales bacterium]